MARRLNLTVVIKTTLITGLQEVHTSTTLTFHWKKKQKTIFDDIQKLT